MCVHNRGRGGVKLSKTGREKASIEEGEMGRKGEREGERGGGGERERERERRVMKERQWLLLT